MPGGNVTFYDSAILRVWYAAFEVWGMNGAAVCIIVYLLSLILKLCYLL